MDRLPLTALDAISLPEEKNVRALLRDAPRAALGKLVVLDDDPTGIQTVHDVPVYTDWERETLLQGLREPGNLFFVLTNSRSFSREQTRQAHRQIGENLAWAAQQAGNGFTLISRSDSTLRGHYPLEMDTLRETLEEKLEISYDGEIIMPYFSEGGRYTLDNVHYVQKGNVLIPAGQTEFALDATFGYRSSDLAQWCQEKTQGQCPAESVVHISLRELRAVDVEGITKKLMAARNNTRYTVDAAYDRDAEVFAVALLRAIGAGKHFLFRSAAGLVRVLGNVERRPLLTGRELKNGEGPGLILVGSHVQKTTEQLQTLLEAHPGLTAICFDVSQAVREEALLRERDRVLAQMETAMEAGQTVVVYTSRKLILAEDALPQDNLAISVRISQALCSLVTLLRVRPGYLIAKGGITSSDVGVKGLGVRRAWVLGQLLPGVPVWRTGKESRFPGLAYVIFPGNVGEPDGLLQAVDRLESGEDVSAK